MLCTPNPGHSNREKATESACRDNVDKVMAQINSTDLSQILIKGTAADTNDVFNLLIRHGAKSGLAVAENLINVFNISIPFHHVPRSLNSPCFSSCSITLSFSPSCWILFEKDLRQCSSPPPPDKVKLKVCKVVLLCLVPFFYSF